MGTSPFSPAIVLAIFPEAMKHRFVDFRAGDIIGKLIQVCGIEPWIGDFVRLVHRHVVVQILVHFAEMVRVGAVLGADEFDAIGIEVFIPGLDNLSRSDRIGRYEVISSSMRGLIFEQLANNG